MSGRRVARFPAPRGPTTRSAGTHGPELDPRPTNAARRLNTQLARPARQACPSVARVGSYSAAVSSFAIDLTKVVGIQVGGSVHRVSDVSIVQATTGEEAAPLALGQCVLASVAVYGQLPERLVVPL